MFTQLARIVAFLTLFLGGFRIAMGIAIASCWFGPTQEALAQFLPADATTGEAIDKGVF
ncbi:hypothetical protein G5V57_24215 [Nordella sp. HKS 07]|uniref:hypothetical protein n=1 Tax=Nordella sp. HKS 07 TaxID=2712222 RepID=UPI0013E184F5|nr:hypothetical protein [Nordella sp. HKS 07]QIG50559.1 hypothetical protein G5V57_24215 [Nordella sp. HKS 07]